MRIIAALMVSVLTACSGGGAERAALSELAEVGGAAQISGFGGLRPTTLPDVDFDRTELLIFNDTGGNPAEYELMWLRLAATGKPVRLGECNSACTMFLSLPDVCLLPGRRFGFHASNFGGMFNPLMTARYPPNIRARFLADWGTRERLTILRAEELVAIEPSLRLCGPRRAG
ncbi:MAG: hypothetical protein ACU0BF_07180 [Paracoccaceae bacterium]